MDDVHFHIRVHAFAYDCTQTGDTPRSVWILALNKPLARRNYRLKMLELVPVDQLRQDQQGSLNRLLTEHAMVFDHLLKDPYYFFD